jgi:hypothetical protein
MSHEEMHTNQTNQRTSIIKDVLVIGFWGGIIWSLVAFAPSYFQFMEVSPKFMLTSWSDAAWIATWLGTLVAVLLFGVLSLGISMIYYALFRKMTSIFAGLIYGVLLWLLLLFVLRPLFPDLPLVSEMAFNTGVSSICLFLLYGLFVGYSISYEYQELQREHNQNAPQSDSAN